MQSSATQLHALETPAITDDSVLVIGHGASLAKSENAAAILRSKGEQVQIVDLLDNPYDFYRSEPEHTERRPRTLLFEAIDRPDLAVAALRWLRKETRPETETSLVALTSAQLGTFDATSFDDFILHPYDPVELLAPIRALRRRRAETPSTPTRYRLGELTVDTKRHEATLGGAPVPLTSKEFGLLAHLLASSDRVVTRDEVVVSVWGQAFGGSVRTVDIHVRRLRAKLGDAFPLTTVRGLGYRLATP